MKRKLGRTLGILTAFSLGLLLALTFISVPHVFAAPIFEDGFETGDLSKWTPIGGTPTVTSGNAHHGTYKAVLDGSYEYAQARFTLTPIDHGFMRAYIMFKSFPTTGAQTAILGLYNWGSSRYMAEARVINIAGTVKWALRYYHNGAHYLAISEQQKPALDTWYCVEVEGVSNTTANAESRIYINGAELTDVSQAGRNDPYTINCAYMWVNCAGVIQWYDCVMVDTAYVGPECVLTVTIAGSGTVAKIPDLDPYMWGTNVTLTATPTVGWTFDHWSGDASGTANPLTVNMTSDKSILATFTQDTYTLTLSTIGSGTVSLNNSGPYYYEDIVELTATADPGWMFSHWSGDLTDSANPAIITIDGNKTVTATFSQEEYALTINVVGNGSVILNNTGPSYHYGDVVELMATADPGWIFLDWTDDVTGADNPTALEMTGNKTVTATFVMVEYTLTVTIVGNGTVDVNATGPYHYGDVVALTATPTVGWSFQGWSGDLSSSAPSATVLIDGDKAATATFTQNVYTLTTTVIGSGSITRSSSDPYHYGDTVELTAVPSTGWTFDHWSGDLSGSTNPATIEVTANKAVTATFTVSQIVGGQSTRIPADAIGQPAAAYSVLTCLFGVLLVALRRKRK